MSINFFKMKLYIEQQQNNANRKNEKLMYASTPSSRNKVGVNNQMTEHAKLQPKLLV